MPTVVLTGWGWEWLVGQGGPWLLVLARTAALAALAPAWGTPGLGGRTRLVLAALLAVAVVPVVGPNLAVPGEPWALVGACAVEIVVGGLLGLSAGLIVAGARQAGEIIGAQAGLSAAAWLDPEAGDGLTPLGHLYGLIALGTFLALDGPLRLVEVLVDSYRFVPAGSGAWPHSTGVATLAAAQIGEALGLAVRAAAPTALALVAAGFALGLLARAAPTLPLLSLSLPIRSAVALLLVLLGLVTLAGTLSVAWDTWLLHVVSLG